MTAVIIVIHLILATAIVGVILLQRSEGGGLGMGGGGGGMGGFMTGRAALLAGNLARPSYGARNCASEY